VAEEMRPLSKDEAPDPSNSYERSHPENESGMGKLAHKKSPDAKHPDHLEGTVKNKQQTDRQINAEDVVDQRATGEKNR
jgi:hypothetical protein